MNRLNADIGDTKNVPADHPEIVARLTGLLEKYAADGRSAPGTPQKNDVSVDIWKRQLNKPRAIPILDD